VNKIMSDASLYETVMFNRQTGRVQAAAAHALVS
jgi:hypothetical protein